MNTQTYLNCTEEKIQDKSFRTQHQSVEIQSYNKHYKAEICPDITQLQKLSELKDACFVIGCHRRKQDCCHSAFHL